jgi:sporulation protein YlmC with PRC-barrel domain
MKNEARQDSTKRFLFLSEILNRKVIDSQGNVVGKVVDLRAKLGELFPPVISVRVRSKRDRKIISFPWNGVASINENVIKLKPDATSHTLDVTVREEEMLWPGLPLIPIMFFSQVINGVVLPAILIFMLILINDKKIMGSYVNGRGFNILAWITVIILVSLSVTLLALMVGIV